MSKSRPEGCHTVKVKSISLVVPCYNEEKRLDTAAIQRLARETSAGHASVLMVNDGSTDDTMTVLKKLKEQPSILQFYS